MKKIALALVASVAVTGVAHAEPFQGPYVGAAVVRDAYEVKGDLDIADVEVEADGLSANGVGGSVYAGYDHSFGSLFAGVEGNATLTSASATLSVDDEFDARVRARESFGLSGRVGAKVADSTGIYARLGWQTTKFKASLAEGTTKLSGKDWQDAFVYGAGLETALSPNTSVRVEYTIEDYGSAGLGVDGLHVDNNKLALGVS